MEKEIKVTYDGLYPSLCMGRLQIIENEIVLYSKEYCLTSSGSCGFNADWSAVVTSGELSWDDARDFSTEIQDAVKECLSEYSPCCGGCM